MMWKQRIWTFLQITGLAIAWLGSGAGCVGRKTSRQGQTGSDLTVEDRSLSAPKPVSKELSFRIAPKHGSKTSDLTAEDIRAYEEKVLTSENRGRTMAVLVDDEVYSAPAIQSTIRDRGMITGNFTREEIEDLCRALDSNRK
ncbi:MAG: hypothetical protein HN909_01735 [Phycisphaerales bacterium]|jgi:preprotein translocase subunit SecD|nr:hypothetical protein [Phycisphaerales bacterium]MBT7170470.1 hypothetical protein [Phycisphaerales bacterium]